MRRRVLPGTCRALQALLELGNVAFEASADGEGCTVAAAAEPALCAAAELLGCDEARPV